MIECYDHNKMFIFSYFFLSFQSRNYLQSFYKNIDTSILKSLVILAIWLALSWVLVVQRIERPPWFFRFFFVPSQCHVDRFTFHNSLPSLKIHHLYSLITKTFIVVNLLTCKLKQTEKNNKTKKKNRWLEISYKFYTKSLSAFTIRCFERIWLRRVVMVGKEQNMLGWQM